MTSSYRRLLQKVSDPVLAADADADTGVVNSRYRHSGLFCPGWNSKDARTIWRAAALQGPESKQVYPVLCPRSGRVFTIRVTSWVITTTPSSRVTLSASVMIPRPGFDAKDLCSVHVVL